MMRQPSQQLVQLICREFADRPAPNVRQHPHGPPDVQNWIDPNMLPPTTLFASAQRERVLAMRMFQPDRPQSPNDQASMGGQ